jgi:hypothetical protein
VVHDGSRLNQVLMVQLNEASIKAATRGAGCGGVFGGVQAYRLRRHELNGVQYIAVQSGWGVDAQKMTARLNTSMKRNIQVPQGGVVWVFAVK